MPLSILQYTPQRPREGDMYISARPTMCVAGCISYTYCLCDIQYIHMYGKPPPPQVSAPGLSFCSFSRALTSPMRREQNPAGETERFVSWVVTLHFDKMKLRKGWPTLSSAFRTSLVKHDTLFAILRNNGLPPLRISRASKAVLVARSPVLRNHPVRLMTRPQWPVCNFYSLPGHLCPTSLYQSRCAVIRNYSRRKREGKKNTPKPWQI